MAGLKWLWTVVLAILASVALTIFFNAPVARTPGVVHYIAAYAGVFFSYVLFAALVAAVIKYLTKAQWVWYDWANIVVVLATCLLIFRDYSPFPRPAASAEQRADVTPASVAPNAMTASGKKMSVAVVGTWICGRKARTILSIYRADGRGYAIVLDDETTPAVDEYSWRFTEENTLVETTSGPANHSFLGFVIRRRIMTMADNLFTAKLDDGGDWSCNRV